MPDETHHIAISFPQGVTVGAFTGGVFGEETSDHARAFLDLLNEQIRGVPCKRKSNVVAISEEVTG